MRDIPKIVSRRIREMRGNESPDEKRLNELKRRAANLIKVLDKARSKWNDRKHTSYNAMRDAEESGVQPGLAQHNFVSASHIAGAILDVQFELEEVMKTNRRVSPGQEKAAGDLIAKGVSEAEACIHDFHHHRDYGSILRNGVQELAKYLSVGGKDWKEYQERYQEKRG